MKLPLLERASREVGFFVAELKRAKQKQSEHRSLEIHVECYILKNGNAYEESIAGFRDPVTAFPSFGFGTVHD
jgi:hypothetical protein